MDSLPIRISSPKAEGILQVSKWLKVQVLLDSEEMQELLSLLSPVDFIVVSEPVPAEEAVISTCSFQEKYGAYVALLKQGQVPLPGDFRRYFSCAMSTTCDAFYAISAGSEKYLIKPIRPVVQLQAHYFFYSDLDGKFHPMVLSEESTAWGLQFSYPQLFQDPETRKVVKVADTAEFPNSAPFSRLQKWMRSATLPTPFEVNGVKTNSSIRVGKKSLAWIKNHPQLKSRGITLAGLPHAH
jgi:hypothetical protein